MAKRTKTAIDVTAELAADTGQRYEDLSFSQVTPAYRVPGDVFIPIRTGEEMEVMQVLADASEDLQQTIKVRDAAEIGGNSEWFAALPSSGFYLEVSYEGEHWPSGYGNMVRILSALAPHLEDARFFAWENNDFHVDEHRIDAGVLSVTRAKTTEDKQRDYLIALARKNVGDTALRAFVAWDTARYPTPQKLNIAAELAPNDDEVLFQRGVATRAAGKDAAALGWFVAAVKTAAPHIPWRLETMAATAIAAQRPELAREWLEHAKPSRSAFVLRGHVCHTELESARAALDEKVLGDPETIFWTRNAAAILADYATHVATLARADTTLAATAARELLRLAEALRKWKLSDPLYEAAAQIDPLGGEVLEKQVTYRHGTSGQLARDGYLAVLERFPDQPEALYFAATNLQAEKSWSQAATLLQRYLAVTTKGYARGVVLQMLPYCLAQDVADADAAENRGDHAAALGLYEAAIARHRESFVAWSHKGGCLANLGRFPEAFDCFAEASRISESYWHTYYAKACALALTGGKPQEIVELARTAALRDPSRRQQIVSDPDLLPFREALEKN